MSDTIDDREHYERWLAEQTTPQPTHNECIALALLPKRHDLSDWDTRVARAIAFLRENPR